MMRVLGHAWQHARALCAAAVLLLVVAPTAAAQALDVEVVDVPPRTSAGRPFPVNVTIENDGPARTVHLFGALYDRVEGEGPCGPASDPRFRTFTHMVQERVELRANTVTAYPASGQRWLHVYDAEDADASPREAELCIFVANATGGPLIEYEAFASTTVSTRARNAAPTASFTWEPTEAVEGHDVRFHAQASDAEGDPVRFAWDFGHFDAGGRDTGAGPDATTSFYPAGSFVVTLIASDGIDETRVTRTITVVTAEAAGEERGFEIPAMTGALAALGAAVAALTRRRG